MVDKRTDLAQSESEADSTEEHGHGTDGESEIPSSPLRGKGNPASGSKTIEKYSANRVTNVSLVDEANDAISQNTDEDEETASSAEDDASDDYVPATTAKNAKKLKKPPTSGQSFKNKYRQEADEGVGLQA